MTIAEYYAAIRQLGLRPTQIPTVYEDRDGDKRSVPDPTDMTPDQRIEVMGLLKFLMGVGPRPF